ncbi:hypothetical protein ACQFN5_13160 [Klebsiella sp. WOUb02]|uniref:hypothetical protein n=1 Tax=Klebsiella sp. WOUb02 TaxID=3161071 RepID=UPI003CEF5ACF
MAVSGKVTLGIFCLIFANFALCAGKGLSYESNNKTLNLKEECVSSLAMNRFIFESKEHYLLNVRLKDNRNCAQKLNSMIEQNIGNRLRTYFNSDLLVDSYIAGILSTEKGFRMPLDSKKLGDEILSFYNKKS